MKLLGQLADAGCWTMTVRRMSLNAHASLPQAQGERLSPGRAYRGGCGWGSIVDAGMESV
jgi:hypothetical protein